MKTTSFLTILAAAAALQFAPLATAHESDPAGEPRRGRYAKMLANLSPDERAKLRAAHHLAMADPAVQAAQDRKIQAAREFRELKRLRMLQADPTLQPILDKLPQRGAGRRGR